MSRLEAARTQLEALRIDKQRLEADNRRLQEQLSTNNPTGEVGPEARQNLVDLEKNFAGVVEENAKLKRLYEDILQQTQASQEQEKETAAQYEHEIADLRGTQQQYMEKVEELHREVEAHTQLADELRETLGRQEEKSELQQLRAMAVEKQKWEDRELRLLAVIEQLHEQLRPSFETTATVTTATDAVAPKITSAASMSTASTETAVFSSAATLPLPPSVSSLSYPVSATDVVGAASSTATTDRSSPMRTESPSGVGRDGVLSAALPATGEGPRSLSESHIPVSMTAPFAQQLPPLSTFFGEMTEEETFLEWLEQFDMMAAACRWDDLAKLVNLVTRLKKQAFSFYRSCGPTQRTQCFTLVDLLTKRFTPVSIPFVRSSLFHDRKQNPNEDVDSYAQDLKRLFNKAYPKASLSHSETETLGKSVLLSQFVAGLLPGLKVKVAGTEGDFEQLWVKARFEEAKTRDLQVANTGGQGPKRSSGATQQRLPQMSTDNNRRTAEVGVLGKSGIRGKCFDCGRVGHRARDCPDSKPKSSEASGTSKHGSTEKTRKKVSAIVSDDSKNIKTTVQSLREQLREAELEAALQAQSAQIHGVTSDSKEVHGLKLGPVLYMEVEFEGCPSQALVDTGSPVTIVSLDYALKALREQCEPGQTAADWKQEMQKKIQKPTVGLRSFGGERLNILGQFAATIEHGSYTKSSFVLVQADTPVNILLGTDFLPDLGFLLMKTNQDSSAEDLLMGEQWSITKSLGFGGSGAGGSRLGSSGRDRSNEDLSQIPIVRLLQATRLPANHARMVRAVVDGTLRDSSKLFEPCGELAAIGLCVEEGIVEPNEDCSVTLVVQNENHNPVYLPEEQIPGQISCVTLTQGEDDTSANKVVVCAGLQNVTKRENFDRRDALWELLLPDEASGLTITEASQLKNLITKFADVFALDETELGVTDLVHHKINTGDQVPIRQAPRRVPFTLRKKVEEMVGDMLDKQVIQPSKSPWASPVVLVTKKDGGCRFCVDYRRLNAATKMDVFPLPRIDDSLDSLAHAKYFTTLDLAAGYWKVPMDQKSQEKTAFITHSGLYEFRVMPFGLCNAPATFQRLMETVLAGLARNTCMVYLDDILVVGRTLDEHQQDLEKVFERLRTAGLRLKPRKCHFVSRMVKYLGYVVTDKRISADPKKVEAIVNFPTPKDVKSLRSFAGLASYYRRFIPAFSKTAAPLFTLMKKDAH